MQEQLSYLLKLQKIDSDLDGVSDKIAAIEESIKAKTGEIDGFKSALKSTKEKLSSLQLSKKQCELDVESKEQQLKKFQAELNSLKSNDAYKTMLGEIGSAKSAIEKSEDQILVLMESIDSVEKEHKQIEQTVKNKEGVARSEIQALENDKNAHKAEQDKFRADREALVPTIPAGLVAQYEAIREKRGGPVVVPLVAWACGGCRMNFTPNKYNEVKKGKSLVVCDSCSRIVYAAPDETTVPAPPADSKPDTITAG